MWGLRGNYVRLRGIYAILRENLSENLSENILKRLYLGHSC